MRRFRMRGVLVSLLVLAGAMGAGCEKVGVKSGEEMKLVGIAEGEPELREVLADMAKSHGEKTQLAWYVSTPLRGIDPQFKGFYANMGVQQKELLGELKGWAKKQNVSLTHRYSDDAYGRSLKMMEGREEAKTRVAERADFQRDMLMNMYHDYVWQVCLVEAVLPRVKDGELKAYLKKSKTVHEAGIKEIEGMLKRYRYQ